MKFRRTLALAFVYIGSVIGAGFLSGQEIWRFIARHGRTGLFSIALIAVFFIILAPLLYKAARQAGIENYQDFFYRYLPGPFPYIFDLFYSLFLLGSVSVMLAGAGTLFNRLLGLPYSLGVVLTITFLLFTLILKNEGIMTVNSILIPVLILLTIYMLLSFLNREFSLSNLISVFLLPGNLFPAAEWIKDGLYYGAYNLAMALAVMTGIVHSEEEEVIFTGGVIGGSLITLLLFLIYLALLAAFPQAVQVASVEMPLLSLAEKMGSFLYLGYILVLYFAIITTAIANYYAFTRRFSLLLGFRYEFALLLGLLLILPLLPSGFSALVDRLYPLFGSLALIIIFIYMYIFLKEARGKG
ncbi:MAG: hypothetical protein GX336_03160 [Halanaerobiaceae bacterium]|nr:hypothetical protein [Halanaerobiaceae bacterium]